MQSALLFDDTGELGNRLVTFSHLLAFGQEHQVPVVNLCFWRYAHFFRQAGQLCEPTYEDGTADRESLVDAAVGRWLSRELHRPQFKRWQEEFRFDGSLVCGGRALAARALGATLRKIWQAAPSLAGSLTLTLRRENRWHHDCAFALPTSLGAEPLMDPSLVLRHAARIRPLFALRPAWAERVADFLGPLRQRYSRLVGVHLRRGDYATYRGGRWHFDDAVFARALLLLRERSGEGTGFVVATNDTWSPDSFAGLELHRAPGHLILDMYALAGCDQLLGPPSTFSGWASFMGQKPITFLESGNDGSRLAEAEVWTPQYY